MTRFKGTILGRVGNTTLTVKVDHRAYGLFDLSDRAAEIVYESRVVLQETIAQLHTYPISRKLNKLASQYFLTDPGRISEEDLHIVRGILLLTSNGLAADVTLKIADRVAKAPTPDDDAVGEVTAKSGTGIKPKPSKPYHTFVHDLGDQRDQRYGAIKIEASRLMHKHRILAITTLIHEATHKYAGTIDYNYTLLDEGVIADKNMALKNADSYAWFALDASM
jgi:hypothetical protein